MYRKIDYELSVVEYFLDIWYETLKPLKRIMRFPSEIILVERFGKVIPVGFLYFIRIFFVQIIAKKLQRFSELYELYASSLLVK